MGLFSGLFGSSKSVSSDVTNVKQVIDNSTDLKVIKDNINKNIINTITKNSTTCSASTQAKQKKKLVINSISGVNNLNIDEGSQTQKVTLNLACVNVIKDENDMANDVANAFADHLATKFDTGAMAKLEANAKSKSKSGFLSLGSSNSDSNVTQNYKLNITNKINQTMKDIITNETQRNFNTKNLAVSISNLQASQAMDQEYGSISNSSNINLKMGNQNQITDLLMKAISNDSTINNTIDKITNKLNDISTTGVTTKSSLQTKSSTSASSKTSGVDSIFSSLESLFMGNMMLFILGPIILIIIIVALYFMLRSSGGKIPEVEKFLHIEDTNTNTVPSTVPSTNTPTTNTVPSTNTPTADTAVPTANTATVPTDTNPTTTIPTGGKKNIDNYMIQNLNNVLRQLL